MNILCIYHRKDIDGWMSAAIVKKWVKQHYKNVVDIDLSKSNVFPKSPNHTYLFFQGYHYGDSLNLDFKYFDKIIVVDVSLNPISMTLLSTYKSENIIDDFIWIDHHLPKIESLTKLYEESNLEMPRGNRDIKYSACENLWKTLFPKRKIPTLIEKLGMYDSWRHINTKRELEIFHHQYGSRSLIHNYEEAYEYLEKHFKNSTRLNRKIMDVGKQIYNYLKEEAKYKLDNAFVVELVDKIFLTYNENHFDPRHFGFNINEMGYDGFISFHLENNEWVFSMRSSTVDVSKIASIFNGGGHKKAAGFRLSINELNKVLQWKKN
jgi:oligoribonuclease NrnB/cAMP/cGMP phosphodiesterase (DHH superfamily)